MDFFAQDVSLNPLSRKRCVLGCGTQLPACPKCPKGQQCSLIPMSCDSCQHTICVPGTGGSDSSQAGKKSISNGNIGAIAGGAIAGIVIISALVYCVWRFCIKPKRQHFEQDIWMDNSSVLSGEKERSLRQEARMSTHTVASVASSTLTRASNVIQIAYIPGVTNRGSAPSTPGLLVPPVPPIPFSLSSAASTPNFEQEHFFMPRDLRDSTYTDRTSYARHSVASTLYGKNAVVSPVPAQTAQRGKAAVVSVHKNANSNDFAPPVPNVDYDKFGMAGPPSPAFSVGSTFLSNANAATITKPLVVKLSSLKDRKDNDSDHDSTATTIAATPSPTQEHGPFVDPNPNPLNNGHTTPLPSATVSPMSSREPLSIPNLPELDTPRSQQSFSIPNLPELDTSSRRSRQSVQIPNLPELDTSQSQSPKSHKTPFGDENEITTDKSE